MWLQDQFINFIKAHPKIKELCPYPSLPTIYLNNSNNSDNYNLNQMDFNPICVNQNAVIGLIVGNDSIRSNGKDQSAYFDRSLLIEILEAIPEEQVCLTIQENYPLLITPTCQREYTIALVTMNYNLETEEEEEKDDDEDD
jgi:hypothetical protein